MPDPSKKSDASKVPPQVQIIGSPEPLPLYNCIVLSQRMPNGKIHGRVANLEGLEYIGDSERNVLQELVRQFKQSVAKFLSANQTPPWIDPPAKPGGAEIENIIPIHF